MSKSIEIEKSEIIPF